MTDPIQTAFDRTAEATFPAQQVAEPLPLPERHKEAVRLLGLAKEEIDKLRMSVAAERGLKGAYFDEAKALLNEREHERSKVHGLKLQVKNLQASLARHERFFWSASGVACVLGGLIGYGIAYLLFA